MKIVFTNHAKYRIEERNISILNIKNAIKYPVSKKIDQYGMIVVNKDFGKKTLEVVYKLKSDNYIVITAYYL